MDFTAGDIVQLRSGGPDMTVEEVGTEMMTNSPAVFCVWFESAGKHNQVMRESFPPVTLKKAIPSSLGSVRMVRG